MGHDFIEYKGQNIRLNDFNIWMLRHFLLCVSNDKQLSTFVENIEWLGPGIFTGTEFHKFVEGDSSKLVVLISTLKDAREIIKSFGEFIPLEYLEQNVNVKTSYFTADQPVGEYVQNIESILSAISEADNA